MATPRKDPKDYLPTGRPSKYEDSMCETVVSCMKKGYIVDEVCLELGIHRDTFFEWLKVHPEFSDCYKKGRAAFSAFWARAYKKVMMGIPLNPPKKPNPKTKAEKVKSREKEKEEEALQLGRANPAMMIFYMKAHCGWRETIVNKDIVEFNDIPEATKTRLSQIFNTTKNMSTKIKPAIIEKKGTTGKRKNGE